MMELSCRKDPPLCLETDHGLSRNSLRFSDVSSLSIPASQIDKLIHQYDDMELWTVIMLLSWHVHTYKLAEKCGYSPSSKSLQVALQQAFLNVCFDSIERKFDSTDYKCIPWLAGAILSLARLHSILRASTKRPFSEKRDEV